MGIYLNYFKAKCRYILRLSACDSNLFCCQLCIPDRYAKFTHSLIGAPAVPPVIWHKLPTSKLKKYKIVFVKQVFSGGLAS